MEFHNANFYSSTSYNYTLVAPCISTSYTLWAVHSEVRQCFAHSHHIKFLMTSGLLDTYTTSNAVSFLTSVSLTAFRIRHLSTDFTEFHTILGAHLTFACRSIKGNLSRRYPIIRFLTINLHLLLVYFP